MIKMSATFSEDRRYRYTLWRVWGSGERAAMFVGLNPSTATESVDDPTIRCCIRFAKDWGYDALCMTNIFAYRATDPNVMKEQSDPIGPKNDEALLWAANQSEVIIAAWGVHGLHLNREAEVRKLLKGRLSCLRLTKAGHPGHPLYLPSHLRPILWREA